LRVESGAQFTANLINALAETTIIHWHGLHVPAKMDGHPRDTTQPGASYSYDFTVRNRGGTYWYHTHAHGLTTKQAYIGLASFFLVEDDEQRKLAQALELKLGDIVWANLTANAVHTVTPRSYRLRSLNGSNARICRLAFVKGEASLPLTVMGTDGGLIEKPETVTEAFLAPGERLDVLFDAGQAQPGDTVFLKSLAFDAMENEGDMVDMGGMLGIPSPGMGQMMNGMGTSRLAQAGA
jgi:blue copper oxidase